MDRSCQLALGGIVVVCNDQLSLITSRHVLVISNSSTCNLYIPKKETNIGDLFSVFYGKMYSANHKHHDEDDDHHRDNCFDRSFATSGS